MTTTAFSALAHPGAARPDPSKHVNYTYGMLLGVEDFIQEFAYHEAHLRAALRDVVGYGTLSGVAVRYERGAPDGSNGSPRLVVQPGTALAPSGQLIHVHPAQCADLDAWLAARTDKVAEALTDWPASVDSPLTAPYSGAVPAPRPGSLPAAGSLTVHVVLSYRTYLSDEVPVPGEPCRSEEDLMAPSRTGDSFSLDLRFTPPRQGEDDLLRRFTLWLRAVPVVPSAPDDIHAFADHVRTAAGLLPAPYSHGGDLGHDAGGPKVSLSVDEAFEVPIPPGAAVIPPGREAVYHREAFRIWATEVRPRIPAAVRGCEPLCAGPEPGGDSDGLLLATLDVPVRLGEDTSVYTVDPESDVRVDEARRPVVASLRLVDEWAGSGARSGAWGSHGRRNLWRDGGEDAGVPAPATVAAGRFAHDGTPLGATFGNLRATPVPGRPHVFRLGFDGYRAGGLYVVKGTVMKTDDEQVHFLEEVPDFAPQLAVRIMTAQGDPGEAAFSVEISSYEV
ncbi:hypothetical protein [Streptomyces sp. NPDC059916]|uniref:hypothetical protein n=1 Tax=Streptomyces sp. NPDC059916 TaxID=3347001 RepID=UPI0036C3597D